MRTLFISQPFHGRTEEEIFAERATIVDAIEKTFDEKFIVIDQYHQKEPVIHSRFYYLSNDILMLGAADLIVFAPGWEKASGCKVEYTVCREYGLNAFLCRPYPLMIVSIGGLPNE